MPIGHTQCGMVNLMSRKRALVDGLVEGARWERNRRRKITSSTSPPTCEIGNEVEVVVSEAERLRLRYPEVEVASMLYKVEDDRLYLIRDSA